MNVLPFVIGMLVVLVGLGVSIALHEVGHLVPAKLFKVRVGKYMIGFGPTLFAKKVGETEYGVKLIPAGGYISMAGMYPRAAAPVRAGAGTDGAVVDDDPARRARREGFFASMVQDARDADEETREGAGERTFSALPTWKRIIIMLGGPVMNLILAIVLFTIVFSGIGIQTATTTLGSVSECVVPASSSATSCSSADPIAPAAEAGLKPGDRIVSVDGTTIDTFAQMSTIVAASPGTPLTFVIERDGADQTVTITPVEAERATYSADGKPVTAADGTPVTEKVGMIGVGAATEYVRQPVWTGAEQAFTQTGAVVGVMAQLPVKLYHTAVALFTGGERDPNGPISVVGVGVIAGEVATTDSPILNRVSMMIGLVASLNIALFVFNLIPLLPLDGGHVAIALWDALRRGWAKVRGKPAPAPTDAARLVPVTFVVVVLLIGMGALLLAADIFNPVKLLG